MSISGLSSEDCDFVFKILMIGDSSVGKTTFLRRYINKVFESNTGATLGVDLQTTSMTRRNRKVKLQIWDTAGQERFRSLGISFYRMGMAFVLMYDVTNEESFKTVNSWLANIQNYARESVRVVLVGNKSDMESERMVSEKRGRKLAETQNLHFLETSAKTGDNINEAFECIVDLLLDEVDSNKEFADDASIKKLSADDSKKVPQKGCPCNI